MTKRWPQTTVDKKQQGHSRIGFIGDLHFSPKNYQEMSKALSVAVSALLSADVDIVIQLGDCWDHYNISTGQTSVATIVHALRDQLEPLAEKGIPTYIIEGNHDQSIRGLQGSYFKSSIQLLSWHMVFPIDQVEVVPLTTTHHNMNLLALPWQPGNLGMSLESVKNIFDRAPEGEVNILAGHFLLEGAKHNGRDITDGEFFIPQDWINSIKHDVAAAGHVHHRQSIYAGIIMQNNLSDAGAPTGVRVVDIGPGNKIHCDTFIEIKTPRYKLIETDDNTPESIKNICSKINPIDKYVIRVKNKKIASIPVPENVRLEYKPETEATSRLNMNQDSLERMSMVDMFVLWAKRQGHDERDMELAVHKLKERGIA